jgi:hypothetical protein
MKKELFPPVFLLLSFLLFKAFKSLRELTDPALEGSPYL